MLRFKSFRIVQPSGKEVFAFAATAPEILQIAEIPRIGRGKSAELLGYQRPEVISHIAEIRRYLESPEATLPNTIVLAFDDRVRFTPLKIGQRSETGWLKVPLPLKGEPLPGFVVDGQQRLAALMDCSRTDFRVYVTALIAPDVAEQRRLFMLVNRTKPLPKELVFELLAGVDGDLPPAWMRERQASRLMSRLNLEPESFLYRQIKTATCPVGTLKDTSVKKVLVNSLSDGALFEIASGRNGTDPEVEMVHSVSTFWEGVAKAFPEAWGLPPARSRLTHGVGVVSMGYVMDHLYARELRGNDWTAEGVARALEVLRPYCAWTTGIWRLADGVECQWNDFQNVDRHIRMLTNHLRRILDTEGSGSGRNGKLSREASEMP
jgi:DGQHR domain-containing protein